MADQLFKFISQNLFIDWKALKRKYAYLVASKSSQKIRAGTLLIYQVWISDNKFGGFFSFHSTNIL